MNPIPSQFPNAISICSNVCSNLPALWQPVLCRVCSKRIVVALADIASQLVGAVLQMLLKAVVAASLEALLEGREDCVVADLLASSSSLHLVDDASRGVRQERR